MKKTLLLLLAILCLVSCDWEYCRRCNHYKDYCTCNYEPTYRYDYFCANTLIGVWQIDYNIGYERGLGMTPKQIQFFNNYTCDITYSVGRETEWWTDTYTYTYTGSYIRFNNGYGSSFSFKVRGYLFPELYLEDSFGHYTWRLVR